MRGAAAVRRAGAASCGRHVLAGRERKSKEICSEMLYRCTVVRPKPCSHLFSSCALGVHTIIISLLFPGYAARTGRMMRRFGPRAVVVALAGPTPCAGVGAGLLALRAKHLPGHQSPPQWCGDCHESVPTDHWHGHLQSRQHNFNVATRPALEREGVAAPLPATFAGPRSRHVWCRVCDVAVEVDGHRDDVDKWRVHLAGRQHRLHRLARQPQTPATRGRGAAPSAHARRRLNTDR